MILKNELSQKSRIKQMKCTNWQEEFSLFKKNCVRQKSLKIGLKISDGYLSSTLEGNFAEKKCHSTKN